MDPDWELSWGPCNVFQCYNYYAPKVAYFDHTWEEMWEGAESVGSGTYIPLTPDQEEDQAIQAQREDEFQQKTAFLTRLISGTGTGTQEEWAPFVTRNPETHRWRVDWGGRVTTSLNGRHARTMIEIANINRMIKETEDGVNAMGLPFDFFGANLDSEGGVEYKQQLKKNLETCTPMRWDNVGNLVLGPPPIIMPTTVKLFPNLLLTKLGGCCEAALNAYEDAVEKGTLLNWAHGAEHAEYMGKLIWKVQTPTGTCVMFMCMCVRTYFLPAHVHVTTTHVHTRRCGCRMGAGARDFRRTMDSPMT